MKDKQAVLDQVRNMGEKLRGELGHRIGKQLRIVPELNFYIDDSLDRIEEVDNLLKKYAVVSCQLSVVRLCSHASAFTDSCLAFLFGGRSTFYILPRCISGLHFSFPSGHAI